MLTAMATVMAVAVPAPAAPRGWDRVVAVRNVVASSPVAGGGYPDPSGVPEPGTCAGGALNSNRSESWVAVKPGTEDLVGVSKFFFDRYSTFYNFHLGSYAIPGGSVAGKCLLVTG